MPDDGTDAAARPARCEFDPVPNAAMTAYHPVGWHSSAPVPAAAEVPERAAFEITYVTPDGVRHACHAYWLRGTEWAGRPEAGDPGWLVMEIGAFVLVRYCGVGPEADDLLPAFGAVDAADAGGMPGGG
jgi:hypothetical protein